MTATTQTTKRRIRQRPSVRLGAMEVLGFIDGPGTTTWTTSEMVPTPVARPTPASAPAADQPTIEEILETWVPNEVQDQLTRKKVRWGSITAVIALLTALTGAGYWIYSQPQQAAVAAVAEVTAEASALQANLWTLSDLNETLVADHFPESAAPARLLAVDDQARALFGASGNLPSSEAESRALAADGASDVLDASRLVGDALAYRIAVIPILFAPELETDASFIDLDDAAFAFGEWRLRFDTTKAALPTGILSDTTSELGLISAELDEIQARYLDALRNEDGPAAVAALDTLSARLWDAGVLLDEGLAGIQERVATRIDSAGDSLALLLG